MDVRVCFHYYFMTLQRRHLSVHRDENDMIPAENCLQSNLRLDSEGWQDKMVNRCRLSRNFISKTVACSSKPSFFIMSWKEVLFWFGFFSM